MKNKRKITRNFILAGVAVLLVVFIIDFKLEGVVAEFFQRNILTDIEKVNSHGMDIVRGTFRWIRLKDILITICVSGGIILMSTVYITAKTTRKRARKEVIQEIEERINLFSEDKKVSENEEMKVLDYYVREVVQRGERSEEQMKREMEKKNDLVTYLAHDLKTPLTSVIGYLTILDESELPKEIREEYTRKVLSRAYDLENLTNQFFDITRFNLNEIPLNKRGMNGEFFFTQITEELYPLMKEKGMRVEVHIPKEMEIYGDGKLLARVFNNLMKNAVAYSFRDTEISLYGEELGDDIEIRIENHGEVIDHRELQLIFEKFYRRDISRNRTKGAGLGLAIAKEIVQKHGGELSATSTGGKTEFKVRLPKS